MKILRNIGAALCGMLVAGIVISMIEFINSLMYPLPEGVSPQDYEAMREHVKTLPTLAFLVLLLAWTVGAFVGPFVARRLTYKQKIIPGVVVWIFFLVATVVNLFMLPHPIWLFPAAIVSMLLFGGLGLVMAAPKQISVETSRVISAPVEKVFATLSSIEEYSKAVPGIENVEFLSEKKVGVGTRFRETRTFNGKQASTVLEVTELVPNKMIRMVSDEGGTIWDTVFTVESTISSDATPTTKMSMKMDARPYRLFAKALIPMILGMVSKAIESDMDAVKSYCEK